MIKELSVTNFQSHEKSKLTFHEGVNVIVGASDSGKTALIRAMRWLIWGRPTGDSIRSNWGGDTSVTLVTENGKVVRDKDKSDSYVLATAEGEEFTFKAFGTTVPQEVQVFLNLSEINLQSQLDSPFLLSMSPGDVATFFNNVAHLQSIDRGTTNVNSAIRELTADIKYKSAEEVKLTEELSKYEHIQIYEYDVENLEELEKEKVVLANSVNKLHAVTSAYRLTDANLKEKSEILKLEHPLNNILDLIDQKKHAEANFDKLYGLEADILRCEEGIKHINETLTMEKPVLELLELYSDKKIVQDRVLVLSVLLSNLKGIQDRITKGNAFISLKNKEWDEYMPVGSICPLCNQKIN